MTNKLKLTNNKQKILTAVVAGGFVLGLSLSIVLFNLKIRGRDDKLEVTFINPHQVVIFWKTNVETIGSVRYGSSVYERNLEAEQTSSIPGNIHTVVLDNVPQEGFYISIHNQSDRFLLWPKVIHIKFDPATFDQLQMM